MDAILMPAGVAVPRAERSPRQRRSAPIVETSDPNDVGSTDFEGWFRLDDGTRCDSLTVNDEFSRASLACRAMASPKSVDAKLEEERAFERLGLPRMMLSHNGRPFAFTGLYRLPRLGVWLLRFGVQSLLIDPG